jgi:2-polyprenyl-3-methyl-5-hydroxy-6-metoxy-1,4-benzoquinol methylase
MTTNNTGITSTAMPFANADPVTSTPYVLGPVLQFTNGLGDGHRVLDLGCGNGFWAGEFDKRGCTVVGIDPSTSGIAIARETHPRVRFEVAEAAEGLLATLDEAPFDLIVSTEVVEHLYSPQMWAATCFAALRPGGILVLSTPYHGWLKNVALAASGKLDRHLDCLREGGHIKFFSRETMETLLTDSGFENIRFAGAGRMPMMWKSMVLAANRPST